MERVTISYISAIIMLITGLAVKVISNPFNMDNVSYSVVSIFILIHVISMFKGSQSALLQTVCDVIYKSGLIKKGVVQLTFGSDRYDITTVINGLIHTFVVYYKSTPIVTITLTYDGDHSTVISSTVYKYMKLSSFLEKSSYIILNTKCE